MAKKHKGGDHGDIHADERWLITYADMITLLLAVFIVMYALSDTNLRKFNAFAQSLSAAFSTDVMSGSTQFTVTEGQATTPDTGASQAAMGYLGTEAQTVQAVVKNYAIEKGIESSVSVNVVPQGVSIQIAAGLLFQTGRATLDPQSTGLLGLVAATVADVARKFPETMIRVEGNTDAVPVSGPLYADNWELSAARALTILHFLADSGVAADRLVMAGNGANNPLPSLQPDDVANRRVEIWLISPDTSTTSAAPTPAIEPITPSFAPLGG